MCAEQRLQLNRCEVLLIRPGPGALLARIVMNVTITEKLYDAAFVRSHPIGFEEPSQHALPYILRWERRDGR